MLDLIYKRFSKAILSYDKNATAQKEIAEELYSLIKRYVKDCSSLLEIGCGTGFLTKDIINIATNSFTINDLCSNFKDVIENKIKDRLLEKGIVPNYVWGDCKTLISAEQKYSLITSSSAIQWVDSYLEYIKELRKILLPNGIIAISTFAPDNLLEIRELTGNTLNYSSKEEIYEQLSAIYTIKELYEKEMVIEFSSPLEVLKHLKLTGVNSIESTKWTKRDIDKFSNNYKKFITPSNRFPLTYKPIFIVAEREEE